MDENSRCCSTNHQCGINEGSCDSNDDCIDSLVCGKDNCPPNYPTNAACCAKSCKVNSCKNNGTCFIGLNIMNCKCPFGYEGSLCEIDSKFFTFFQCIVHHTAKIRCKLYLNYSKKDLFWF